MRDRFLPNRPVPAFVLAATLIFPAAAAKAYWRDGVWIEEPPPSSDTPPPPATAPPAYQTETPPNYDGPPPMATTPPGYGYGAPPQGYGAPPQGYDEPPPEYGSAPPPPGYGAPPQANAYGMTCYAGVYICPLAQPGPVGAGCTCPGIGAPSYGMVR